MATGAAERTGGAMAARVTKIKKSKKKKNKSKKGVRAVRAPIAVKAAKPTKPTQSTKPTKGATAMTKPTKSMTAATTKPAQITVQAHPAHPLPADLPVDTHTPAIIHYIHNRESDQPLSEAEFAAYQEQSLRGASHFDACMWVEAVLAKRGGSQGKALLDVGAINALRYVPGKPPLRLGRARAIDLHVLGEDSAVEQADFLELDPKQERYDYVVLSLVVNFEVDPRKRGAMMLQANKLLAEAAPDAGLCFFVLPKACFERSRYLNYEVFSDLCTEAGFTIEERTVTDRLSMFVLARTSAPVGSGVPRRKVRTNKGAYNNFAIIIKTPASAAGPTATAAAGRPGKKLTSNQRKRARKAKMRELARKAKSQAV
ncbi:uncharacterized protein AMSG_04594 [Thecamonas trahens ATCC 50062]|uniref:Uncharacterized protein n=1 Tax=Thecamonas trahens ATCC 50062 TaxID=461836 RepID=A0A0L0D930_THETB|nr:hypothetical protein AMSG_04594 [Thecamonas trahens ATCC 50062]KNC48849.1 hypothetical protein AMSG_04594 [Thecamonas trahens ATCC 50062]|eukprot:XP_013758269.1 hypothetical protein AMSG_04594 [Thecamonas trahens ATCC 50062]